MAREVRSCPYCQQVALRCWVPFKPFGRGVYCPRCDEVVLDLSRVSEWLWQHTLGRLWNGRIEVEG